MKPKKKSNYCSFEGCNNNSSDKRMYRFPKDKERCLQWIHSSKNSKILQIPIEKLNANYRICEDHFDIWCFMNATDKSRLVHNAVPGDFK